MKLKSLALLAALAAMPAPPAVWAQDKPGAMPAAMAPMTDEDARLVRRAIDRGQLMYAYDQAAWHGTDDLKIKLPDFAARVDGWIVDGPAQSPHLIFYSRDEQPRAVYVADFRDNRLVSGKVLGPGDDTTLSPARLSMIEARRAARTALASSPQGFCAKASPNSIVLPPETPDGPYLVYFMTPQTANDSIPAGGHYLFEVARGKVLRSRGFTRSCISLSLTAGGKGRPAALVVSHLLDPVPTEIHVFTMFAARLPVDVVTTGNGRIWAVESVRGQARIRILE